MGYHIHMKDKREIKISEEKIKDIVAKVCKKHNRLHNFRAWELGSNIVDDKKVFKTVDS
jgi:hypothetical protein